MSAGAAVKKGAPSAQPLDAEAIRAKLQQLIATRSAQQKMRERMQQADERERELRRELATLARGGSLSGFVVDGQSVAIHQTPGHDPTVHVRPVVVL